MDNDSIGKVHRIPAHIRNQNERFAERNAFEDLAYKLLRSQGRIALALGYGTLQITRTITLSTSPTEVIVHTGYDDRLIVIFNNDILAANNALVSQNPTVNNGIPILPGKERRYILVKNMGLYAKAESGTPEIVVQEFTQLEI